MNGARDDDGPNLSHGPNPYKGTKYVGITQGPYGRAARFFRSLDHGSYQAYTPE